MPTPIADLEAAKAAAQLRLVLKGEKVNIVNDLQFIELIFVSTGNPDLNLTFSEGATALSPEKVAFDAIQDAMEVYCDDRIAELDVELVSYGVIL